MKTYLWEMIDLKELITTKEIWSIAQGENQNLPFFIRYREGLYAFRDLETHGYYFYISWNYPLSDELLLPSEAIQDTMDDFEGKLVFALEEDIHAVLAFVFTGQLMRVWNVYAKDDEETIRRIKSIIPEAYSEAIEFDFHPDPAWDEYAIVCGDYEAPTPRDENAPLPF